MSKFSPDVKTKYSNKNIKKPLKYYDDALGIKLTKKGSNTKKDSKRRKSLEIGIHNSLVGVNCVIGKVPLKESKINTKSKIKKVKDFTKIASIDFSTKRYKSNDLEFRKKFAVIATSFIICNEKKIFNKLSKPYRRMKNYEKFRMVKDHEFFELYINFIINLIGKKKYLTSSLFDLYYILNDKDISKDIARYYKRLIKDLSKPYSKIFGDKSDKILSDIFNFTLLLSTGNNQLDIFKNRKFLGLTSEDDLEKLLKQLGRKIIKNGISPMFMIYLQCNPKVVTMYIKEVKSTETVVGLLALSFLDFVFDDKTLHAVVRNLLRRPWTTQKSSKK